MITTKTNLDLRALEDNDPKIVYLKNKRYRITPMNNAVASRLDKYVAKASLSQSADNKVLLVNMNNNRKLVPKCVSLMLLHSFLKVNLFHWIYWRYLHVKYSQEELGDVLRLGMEVNNVGFFLTNTAYLENNNKMIVRMATASSINILQELSLAQETISSSPSMGKSAPIQPSGIGG